MTPTQKTAVRLHPWQLRLVIIATWALRCVLIVPASIALPIIAFLDWKNSTEDQSEISYLYRLRYYASELKGWFWTGRWSE
jgi:hypothetical protein